jgi:hypothetical protein
MKIASTAKRIFDEQCKKTFATKSATSGLVQCSKEHRYSITSQVAPTAVASPD